MRSTAGGTTWRLEESGDLDALGSIWSEIHPNHDLSVEELRWRLGLSPRWSLVFAVGGKRPIGYALAPLFPWHGDGFLTADFGVVPDRRGRGIGSALHDRVRSFAAELGADGIQVEVAEDDPVSGVWLERRGYSEVERQKAVALDLRSAEATDPSPPPGITLETLASRPDLVRSAYETAIEAVADIPGLDSEREPVSFDSWREWELGRPTRRPELQTLAVAEGQVVGYATLDVVGRDAYHGMTAVRRDWRQRGVARALKRFVIASAARAGIERLLTESEERNEPMRRLNESLGYRASPGAIVMRLRLSP